MSKTTTDSSAEEQLVEQQPEQNQTPVTAPPAEGNGNEPAVVYLRAATMEEIAQKFNELKSQYSGRKFIAGGIVQDYDDGSYVQRIDII